MSMQEFGALGEFVSVFGAKKESSMLRRWVPLGAADTAFLRVSRTNNVRRGFESFCRWHYPESVN
ncbi:MAG: hypothetical protein GY792_19990 [Gammaproteobacteria bacterium]|nr:hypothetical protein [Gammaproteobacteria bacterium]